MTRESDGAHYAHTISECLNGTVNLLCECRALLNSPETVAQLSGDKADVAKRLRETAETLKFLLASRRY